MKKKLMIVLSTLLFSSLFIYIAGVLYFQSHFLFHTKINGIDVSFLDNQQTIYELDQVVREYEITLRGRDSLIEKIVGSDIGLASDWGNIVQQHIEEQNPYAWVISLFKNSEISCSTQLNYDKQKLEERIKSIDKFKKENMILPKDALIGEYNIENHRYDLIPAEYGSVIILKKLLPIIEENVLSLNSEIDITDLDCYKKPKIIETDQELMRIFNQMNLWVSTNIRYQFGEKCEVLDGDIIQSWITHDKKEAILDIEQVKAYVNELSRNNDTAFRMHKFVTYEGDTIEINKGHYGWWMNKQEETQELVELIFQGADTDRKPIYIQEAASFDYPDYGDTYIEIDLTNQILYLWLKGKVYLTTELVSGNVSHGATTPGGIYPITYKQRNVTLRGADYASYVSYWMPFNGGIGLHDATWRNKFGGNIYLTNGSHGCINLPVEMAEKIYEQVYTGMPVICYYRTD